MQIMYATKKFQYQYKKGRLKSSLLYYNPVHTKHALTTGFLRRIGLDGTRQIYQRELKSWLLYCPLPSTHVTHALRDKIRSSWSYHAIGKY